MEFTVNLQIIEFSAKSVHFIQSSIIMSINTLHCTYTNCYVLQPTNTRRRGEDDGN